MEKIIVTNSNEKSLRETADAQGYRETFFGMLHDEDDIDGFACTYHADGGYITTEYADKVLDVLNNTGDWEERPVYELSE